MNQATNLIQWKNHTLEVQAEHDFNGYEYEYQVGIDAWLTRGEFCLGSERVYRLVIEPDKWYYCDCDEVEASVELGSDLIYWDKQDRTVNDFTFNTCTIIRPAKPEEIPKPEALEDRIKAEYSDYDVVMLDFSQFDILGFSDGSNWGHTRAQSMKGFFEYVYFVESEGDLYTSREATDSYDNNTIQPVGVLLTRGEG